jgi:hypothetical protein
MATEVAMVWSAQRQRKFTTEDTSYGAPSDLREEVADVLERLSQLLMAHTSRKVLVADDTAGAPDVVALQEDVRFYGQVSAAWADVPADAFPHCGAGFGSTVVVEDLDHGARESFTLMAGPLLDIDAGQVSLASPIGMALLGVKKGAVVTVRTPHRLRRLQVVSVRTLQDRIMEHNTLPAA